MAVAGKPATIVVWSHGLPDVFEVSDGVRITSTELAAAMSPMRDATAADLSKIDCIFNFCYSTDFAVDLLTKLGHRTEPSGTKALPNSVVASCARQRLSYGYVFWSALSEYYVLAKSSATAQPVVDLGTILGYVDNKLYSYGRQPIFDAQNHLTGWKVTEPDRLQNPTVLVPLQDSEVEELREILRLRKDDDVPAFVQIG